MQVVCGEGRLCWLQSGMVWAPVSYAAGGIFSVNKDRKQRLRQAQRGSAYH